MKKIDDDSIRFSLFPSVVYVLDFSELVDDVSAICEEIDWFAGEEFPMIQTRDLNILDSYPDIKKVIVDKVNDVLQSDYEYDNPIQMTTSWITRAEPGHPIFKHKHTNCLWSSTFYFKDGCGELTFHKDHEAIFSPAITNDIELVMSGDASFPAQKGKFILFPSHLHHSVTGKHRDVRNSMAMNWMPKGMCSFGDSSYEYR